MEQNNMASILSKLNSPDGKTLIELIKKDSGNALMKALAAVKVGNYQEAQNILEPLLAGTDAEILAKRLANGNG